FYNGCPAFKTGLSQTLQHYRGVLDSLAQQTVQQAGITAEFCDRMFTAFGAPRQILEAVFLESAQSATRYVVRGKVILQPHGKEFFTWYSKHLFTLHGKHFFT